MPHQKSNTSWWTPILNSLRPSLVEFRRNDPLRMAGATAFFTTFALPPILFIIIHLFGVFSDQRTLGRSIIERLTHTIGEDGADQVLQVLRSIRGFSDSWFVIAVGVLFLFFVATTLFTVIKNSFNQIWQISVKEKPGAIFLLRLRLRSLAIILFAGLLFITDTAFEVMGGLAGNVVDSIWPGGGNYFKSALNEILAATIVTLWIIVLFRFLADGRPRWKPVITGGILTGLLFTGGKELVSYLLIESNMSRMFGAAGAFVLILLFVFYSSFILYYGASFIYVYSEKLKQPVLPTKDAFSYTIEAS